MRGRPEIPWSPLARSGNPAGRGREGEALGNRDFAARTGISKSSISRLTYRVHKLGYLSHAPDAARYRMATLRSSMNSEITRVKIGAWSSRASKPPSKATSRVAIAVPLANGETT